METRPLQPNDKLALHSLIRRWEEFWNVPLVTPMEEVEENLTAPFTDLNLHSLGYWEEGRMIAFGHIWHRPSSESQERAYLFGCVDPAERGRGIGRELMHWQRQRAEEILSSAENDLPKFIRADEWDWIEESHRMYRRVGLEPVRYFTEMLKPLQELTTIEPLPGIEIQQFDRSRTGDVMEVLNESFRDHWGSTPTDLESFEHRLDSYGTALDASFIALADDRIVGCTLNAHYPEDEVLLGRRDGWIETLGVLSEFRKRGIATALIQTSFNAFLRLGLTHAALGVDTASPTDAHSLYKGLGFAPTHRSITSELKVRA